MKILKAKNHSTEIKLPLQLLDVKSLRTIPPDNWLNNRMEQFEYDKSFKNYGMIWPIAVSDHSHQWVQERILPKNPHHRDKEGKLISGYYVHIGNKRVIWAKHNGYDKIEGYIVTTKEEKNFIHKLQHIEHKEIPK